MFRKKKSSSFILCIIFLFIIFSINAGCIEKKSTQNDGKTISFQNPFDKPLILPNWIDENYHDYPQTTQFIQRLANEYPDLVDIFSIGKSVEERKIWCVKITNERNDSLKTSCVIDGCIHGSEWESAELCLYLAEYLLINFYRNSSVSLILNTSTVYLIPLLNPDGRQHDYRYNKNGVDLNRNFDVHFGRFRGGSVPLGKILGKIKFTHLRFQLLNKWFPTIFPSHITNSGKRPFSEPETTALKNLLDSLRNNQFSFYMNCHTAVHFIGSVINIDYKPEFTVSMHEKKVLNNALYWFEENTEYDIHKSGDYSFYGAGYAHHWVFKEYHVPSFLFEMLSRDYEPGLSSGGHHDELVYWMKESLPIPLFLLANNEELADWKVPLNKPVLPKGIPPSQNS